MIRAAAFAAVAVAVTACGGSSSPVQMVITPPLVEPPSTFAAAAAPTNTAAVVVPNNNNRRVRARIQSSSDQHYFRVPVTQPGTLTLMTEGVDTRIEAFDIDGNPLEGLPGSLIVMITTEIVSQGAIITKIVPASGGDTGVYTLSASVMTGTGTTTPTTI